MTGKAEPSLADKVVAIHRSLDTAGVPHAIGGALALAYHGEPRMTVDIDVNVFIEPKRWREVEPLLEALGIDTAGMDRVEQDGQVRVLWGRSPVDLFFAYDEVHHTMAEGVERVPFASVELPILCAEDLVFCKAVFDRPKDWIDIDQVLLQAGSTFDLDRVRALLDRIVGPDDARRQRFDHAVERLLEP